jgi:protease-4
MVSVANIEELRFALERFKKSGKFVVAYDDNYTQSEYYLATVADKILLQPEGSLEWKGVGFSTLFFKGLFDKLDVKPEIFRPTECKFKSAVEPYFRTNMSDENRLQMEVLASSIWEDITNDIALSRGINADNLRLYAKNLDINLPEDALSRGMIDRIAYEDELFELYDSYGVKRNDFGLHNTISLYDYVESINISPLRVSVGDNTAIESVNTPLVAIIYAEGQIVDGNMYVDDYVYGSRLADELRQARLNNDTKAVVVRVNSPGGSALASDIAWREMSLLQQAKPVVISMGEMAASGGYYISAPADYIFADKSTLTGSIGVFGVLFNLEKTLKNRLGVTIDKAATSPSAGGPNIFEPLTNEQRNAITVGVDRVYTTFTSHVAEGRNMPIDSVLSVAEGRVWSGSDAIEIGLVDELGGLTHAIAKASQLAGLKNGYKLYEFNAALTPFEQWLDNMVNNTVVDLGFDSGSMIYNDIKTLLIDNPMLITNGGIQTIVPGDIKLEF